jgi:hypothetical protein
MFLMFLIQDQTDDVPAVKGDHGSLGARFELSVSLIHPPGKVESIGVGEQDDGLPHRYEKNLSHW